MLKQKAKRWAYLLLCLATFALFSPLAAAESIFQTLDTPFYDPSSTAACASESNIPASPSTSTAALVWPFATKDTSQYERVDQGWDIQAEAGAAVYAIAPGTIYKFAPNSGGFGNDYPTEKLDNSISTWSDWVYYGHVHVLPNLIGQHVNAGQQIATANTADALGSGGAGQNGSAAPAGWLEIGFAQPNTDAPVQKADETVATQAGATMKSLLINAQPASGSSNGPSNVPSLSLSCSCSSGSTDVTATLPSNIPEPYNSLLTQAAAAGKTNPQFLAAIFLSENGNTWKPFDGPWLVSPTGASGPFQFEPGTWDTYKTDGNNDGVMDINNMYDAAYSAAKMLGTYIGPDAPLGSLSAPFKPGTILEAAAAYNWGEGNVQEHSSGGSARLSVAPTETQNYVNNVYSLITSGFTKSGNPNYADPPGQVSGNSAAQSGSPTVSSCSGVSQGDIVQTALNLSWPAPHTPALEAKPEYLAAVKQYDPEGMSDSGGADCGVFVSTIMRASGADPDYPAAGTGTQEAYVRSHPDKYNVVDQVASTADLQPGDILIVNSGGGTGADGHTYIFVGPQAGGYNEASASLGTRMPSLGGAVLQDYRGPYLRARLKT